MSLRPATEADLDAIIALIRGLAEYEREPDAVTLDREELRRHLFGERPYAEVIVVEDGSLASSGTRSGDATMRNDERATGEEHVQSDEYRRAPPEESEERAHIIGFALFFHNFSTWMGKPGIWLEDLFVMPEYRGRGHGKALLVELARIAVERGCGRFEWSVLDWNEPSIAFYKSLGAVPMDEWTNYRVTGDALERLAGMGE